MPPRQVQDLTAHPVHPHLPHHQPMAPQRPLVSQRDRRLLTSYYPRESTIMSKYPCPVLPSRPHLLARSKRLTTPQHRRISLLALAQTHILMARLLLPIPHENLVLPNLCPFHQSQLIISPEQPPMRPRHRTIMYQHRRPQRHILHKRKKNPESKRLYHTHFLLICVNPTPSLEQHPIS